MKLPRFTFSLRTLLVVMTIGCVWLGVLTARARRQKETVAWIRGMGGMVLYDWQLENADGPAGPRWLHSAIGEDYFQSVASVLVFQKKVDVSQLSTLRELKMLGLADCGVTDINFLSRFHKLESLSLARNNIRDIYVINELPQLKRLGLAFNDISDCSALFGLPRLEELEIQGNPIQAKDVERLRRAFPDAAMTYGGSPEQFEE